ncbi:sulfite exporter TauE/SafE family protein [candidate division KSB1 bacterium]|nr:MAG: sulfite exporter TauE/SafE family protein [candidate division KSB1 bacterium]
MTELLGLVALGFVTGIFSGYLGIGGAVIITPVLLEMLKARGISEDVRFHLVFGTTLLAIIGAVTSSTISYAKVKRVYWAAVPLTGAAAVALSLIGSRLAALSPGSYLKMFFVFFAAASALMLLIKPPAAKEEIPLHRLRLLGIGAIAGIVSAYIGVAGGIIMVPLFILWAGVPTEMAAGTSTAVGILTSLVGAAGYIINGWNVAGRPDGSWGFVMPAIALPILAGTLFGGPLGSRLNRKLGKKVFRYVFAAFLIIIGLKVFFS